MTLAGAIAGIVSGTLTVLLWIYLPISADGATLSHSLYELLPAFVVSSLCIVVVSKITSTNSHHLHKSFVEMEQKL